MGFRKQEEIIKIVVSAIIIVILGIVAAVKNHAEKKEVQPTKRLIQESYSK